jgi:predicted Zn-dependent protease
MIDRHAARAIGLGLLVLAAGCAVNPVSGRPEFTLVSEAKEREIGEEESKKVAAEMGLYEDPALVAYVRSVGERLVAAAPHRDLAYQFHIVDMEEPNAFALPGGFIYVSRGLLALTNDEAELAGILAHEIGHVAAKHSVRTVSRAAPLAVVTGVGAAVTGIVSPMLGSVVGGVGGLAGALVLAPYSRSQEEEADRVGQEMAARAGWDPAGISRSLHTLEREEALHADAPRANSFFATHPPLPRRVADTEERARSLERGTPPRPADAPESFLRRLDGLPVGPRAADGVFDGSLFLHPDLGFHVRFPAGWKTANERSVVGAVAPDKSAAIGVEMLGEGTDPEAAFQALEQQTRTKLGRDAERLTIGGLPALRTAAVARTRDGSIALELTWIALGGRVYRVTGMSRPSSFEAVRPAFRQTAGSFGSLTADERAGIRENRLSLVRAGGGDTLATLLARTRSVWTPEYAAMANGLDAGAPLKPGRAVKAAVARPYTPR